MDLDRKNRKIQKQIAIQQLDAFYVRRMQAGKTGSKLWKPQVAEWLRRTNDVLLESLNERT